MVVIAAGAACAVLAGAAGAAHAFGPSLDEIYRSTLREENGGALPGFVVNRGRPPLPERKPVPPDAATAGPAIVEQDLTARMPWVQVVKEIAGGAPTPFAVEAVRSRAEADDGQAVELLGWMYANGVGVARDLPTAFTLYARAAELGVQGAMENAQAVYKAMSPDNQRAVFNAIN